MSAKVVNLNVPTAPPELSGSALRFWNHVQDQYGIEDAGGLELLRQACGCLMEIDALDVKIKEGGLTCPGYRRHQVRPNPLLKVRGEARRSFLAFTRALRLDISEDK